MAAQENWRKMLNDRQWCSGVALLIHQVAWLMQSVSYMMHLLVAQRARGADPDFQLPPGFVSAPLINFTQFLPKMDVFLLKKVDLLLSNNLFGPLFFLMTFKSHTDEQQSNWLVQLVPWPERTYSVLDCWTSTHETAAENQWGSEAQWSCLTLVQLILVVYANYCQQNQLECQWISHFILSAVSFDP